MVNEKTVILITGPTASGKTSLAIQVAQHFNTEIISADSRQCNVEMNIGVAKPSTAELNAVPHHFINSHSIHQDVNAAMFSSYAHSVAEKIFANRDVLVMAGGTGLYIRAFVEGLDDITSIDPSIRSQLIADYQKNGIGWLQSEVIKLDPVFYASAETSNPQRLLRALEVIMGTGKSIKTFQKNNQQSGCPYTVKKFAIEISRDQLYNNINMRVDAMMGKGLLDEARQLYPYKHLNALQTVGYSELFDYMDNKYSLNLAVEKIKQHTRNYAKRQLTWIRKDSDVKWITGMSDIIKT